MTKKTQRTRYTYKVWVQVERYDEQTDTSLDLDLPFSSSAQFGTAQGAMDFADALHALALAIRPLCQPSARVRRKPPVAADV